MKKSLCFMLVILSFAGSSFAQALGTHSPTIDGAAAIKGGASQALADAAATPLIKCSTGVYALVNWTAGAAGNDSAGYVIATRHSSGSKNFATTNVRTNIFWKQATVVTTAVPVGTAMTTDIAAGDQSAFQFDGAGWTSY